MHRHFRTIRGKSTRNVVLAVIFFVLFYHHTTSSWSSHPALESDRLQHFMNDHYHDSQVSLARKSSFDWSTVPFEYPPGELTPLPTGRAPDLPMIQHTPMPETSNEALLREARREEVRRLFQSNWHAYRKYAWRMDALLPVSGGYKDQFCGWAATLVDTLDTLWIMGLRAEFDEAVVAVAEIDFGQSNCDRVNTFETNIRYLGGLMAAYDLSRRPVLLQKAVELGDFLYTAFNTEHRMPVDFIDFAGARTGEALSVEGIVVSASPGTLSLEMTHLSQLTGDPKYYSAIAPVMDLFAAGQIQTRLPGLWPMWVSMANRDVTSGDKFTLGGCADSLYEYLPKMHALLSGREPPGSSDMFKTMSLRFMAAANESLLFRPMLPDGADVLIAGNADVLDDGARLLDPESEHLACFVGGVYAIGGRLFERPELVDIGAKLARGCAYVYRSMPAGMGPERYNMVACPSRTTCPWEEETWIHELALRPEWHENLPRGFTTVKDPRYILRPEAIESVFVLSRVTGEPEFQQTAWEMWKAVSNGTRTKIANAAVVDVTSTEAVLEKEDYMESFWLAETLKYFYLVFSPPDLISLDDYVLNTEAHPFRRPK